MTRLRWLLGSILVFGTLLGGCQPSPVPVDQNPPSPAEGGYPLRVTDGAGVEVTLAAKPVRIISLTLGTDEILLDLVETDRLLGVTYLADDASLSNIAARPELKDIPNRVDTTPEQIIDLEPDLVLLASWTDTAVIEQLRAAGAPVFVISNFTSIEGVQENIALLGKLVGEPERAQTLIDGMNTRLDEVAAALDGQTGVRVLYLANDGWTSGAETTVNDMIARAGGVNLAAEAGLLDWNQLSEEAIIEYDPEVIVLSTFVDAAQITENPIYADLQAVQRERVVSISDALMSATSQYVVEGVFEMARALYPDLFE